MWLKKLNSFSLSIKDNWVLIHCSADHMAEQDVHLMALFEYSTLWFYSLQHPTVCYRNVTRHKLEECHHVFLCRSDSGCLFRYETDLEGQVKENKTKQKPTIPSWKISVILIRLTNATFLDFFFVMMVFNNIMVTEQKQWRLTEKAQCITWML